MESNTSPQREEIPKYEQSMTSSMHLFANKIIDKIQVKIQIQIQHASFGKVDDSKIQFLHEDRRQAAKWNI